VDYEGHAFRLRKEQWPAFHYYRGYPKPGKHYDEISAKVSEIRSLSQEVAQQMDEAEKFSAGLFGNC